ncbi:cholesterol 24-hydroxylase-like, partial [Diadema antillarum]|uniref:cholesterol 24-hydroxylase-like n=1 Tax=Diadema antillarum TaxID=105358 RepID=UPI003A8BEDD7
MAFYDSLVLAVITYAMLVVIASVVTLFAAYLLYIKYTHVKYRHIPGPQRSSFIFGNEAMLKERLEEDAIGKLVYDMYKKYGMLHKLQVLHRVLIFTVDSKFVKDLLTNSLHTKSPQDYKNMQFVFGERFGGTGLVSELDHSKYEKKRALLNPAFHRKYLMGLIEEFNTSADVFIQSLIPVADGQQEVCMLDKFNNVTLDGIARAGFSMMLDAFDDQDSPFPKAIYKVLNGVMASLMKPWLWMVPTKEAACFRTEVREATRFIRNFGRDIILERMAARRRGEDVPKDILTHILNASDNLSNQGFGMQEMIDEFFTLFIAGQETTGNLLAFTLQQLCRYPHVYEKVKQELDEKLGDKKFVSYEDIMKLEYLMLVLKETMRLFPPVQGTSRILGFDVQYEQYHLPKGTPVMVIAQAMGMMDCYFDNPEEFRPERFGRDNDEQRMKSMYAYIPFSLVSGRCIGQQFAYIESRVILAKLLRRLDFRLVPGQRFTTTTHLTQRPKDGCLTYISRIPAGRVEAGESHTSTSLLARHPQAEKETNCEETSE